MFQKRFTVFLVLIMYFFGLGIIIKAESSKKRKDYLQIGLFSKLSVQHNHFVYSQDLKWGKEGADTSFDESYFNLSFFFDDAVEFDLFYRKFAANSVFIAGGFWDLKKSVLGASLGKVLTAEVKIPFVGISIPIDFSGGPYVSFGFKNEYNYIRGNEDLNVLDQKEPLIGFGIYTSLKFRLRLSQKKRYPMLNLGFKYFIPFNDFEYNPEKENVSYRLERKFFYIGISF